MKKGFENDTRKLVIPTNIDCIKSILENALVAVVKADAAAFDREQNLAIGHLMDIEPLLANAKALYDATIYMHRLTTK